MSNVLTIFCQIKVGLIVKMYSGCRLQCVGNKNILVVVAQNSSIPMAAT